MYAPTASWELRPSIALAIIAVLVWGALLPLEIAGVLLG
jgi:hypothetical protein